MGIPPPSSYLGCRRSRPARGGWIEIFGRHLQDKRCGGPAPHGAGGLKFMQSASGGAVTESRPARGGWIEMSCRLDWHTLMLSRPARGGWIEMCQASYSRCTPWSRPAWGGWIEISICGCGPLHCPSRPAWGGWIEIRASAHACGDNPVSRPAWGGWMHACVNSN